MTARWTWPKRARSDLVRRTNLEPKRMNDASMRRAIRDPPMERCFSVMKGVFEVGCVILTADKRVAVKVIITAIGYNLCNLFG